MISDKVNTEAIDWFVRLRSESATDGDRCELAAWLARSPAHRQAYAGVQRQWEDLEGLRDFAEARLRAMDLPRRESSARKSTALRLSWALAASVALIGTLLALAPPRGVHNVSFPQNVYRTSVGEQRRLLLGDGSTLHLNTDTLVEVHLRSDRRELVLKQGEILVDVAHDEHRPLVVTADDMQFLALGTEFNVRKDSGTTTLIVEEGRVAVLPTHRSQDPQPEVRTIVEAGERATLGRNALAPTAVRVQRVDAGEATAWRDGRLVFRRTPLRTAVAEMNRYFPGEVVIGSDVPELKVTGSFKLRDQRVMLLTLEASLPLRSIDEGGGRTLLIHDPDGRTPSAWQAPASVPGSAAIE